MRTTKRLAVATVAVLVVVTLAGCGSAGSLTSERTRYVSSAAAAAADPVRSNGADERVGLMPSASQVVGVLNAVLHVVSLANSAIRPVG